MFGHESNKVLDACMPPHTASNNDSAGKSSCKVKGLKFRLLSSEILHAVDPSNRTTRYTRAWKNRLGSKKARIPLFKIHFPASLANDLTEYIMTGKRTRFAIVVWNPIHLRINLARMKTTSLSIHKIAVTAIQT
mmetsp:Transcript_12445/g.16147  ORF Transcript_12445/g.16147 Transcript_12445/m.16147 type:complete len:134 (-) Transcript_12445:47-448(-)